MSFRFAIVDDAPFIRELLKQIVSQMGGVCVGEAESGPGALEVVKKTLPDVLFLDLVMPGKNGLEIITDLKSIWPDIKVIVCSTIDDENIIDRARMAGIDHYLTKPFSRELIIAALQKLKFVQPEVTHE